MARIYRIEIMNADGVQALPLPQGRPWLPLSEAVIYILQQAPAVLAVHVEMKRALRDQGRTWDHWSQERLQELAQKAGRTVPACH